MAVSFSVLDNENYIWHFTYKRLQCLCQRKPNPNCLNQDDFCLNAGRTRLMLRSCLDVMLLPQFYYYTDLSKGADSVSGQLHGGKKVPLHWRNPFWQSLEEGAGKQCLEFDMVLSLSLSLSVSLSLCLPPPPPPRLAVYTGCVWKHWLFFRNK